MSRYRTEIVIPADRIITLHLPEDLPEGRARIVVEVETTTVEDAGNDPLTDTAPDIEWWEEFGDDPETDEPWGLRERLIALES